MKLSIALVVVLYVVIAVAVFAMHTQMPVTFELAIARSILWPVWLAGGLQGSPMIMD